MSLSEVVSDLDTFAETAVQAAITAGKTFGQQVKQEVENVESGTETVPQAIGDLTTDAASDMSTLVKAWGAAAVTLVTDAMSDVSIPLVSEQTNLAATSLIDQAAQQGVTIAEADATTLINNAEVAVASKVKQLLAAI